MTAKKYLRHLWLLDRKIDLDLKELERWKELSTRVSGSNFEEHYNPNRPTEAPFVKSLERIYELEEKITKEIDAYVDFKARATELIRMVPDFSQREILELRYLARHTWDDIAAERCYTTRWVYELHGRALQAFDRILEETGEKEKEFS